MGEYIPTTPTPMDNHITRLLASETYTTIPARLCCLGSPALPIQLQPSWSHHSFRPLVVPIQLQPSWSHHSFRPLVVPILAFTYQIPLSAPSPPTPSFPLHCTNLTQSFSNNLKLPQVHRRTWSSIHLTSRGTANTTHWPSDSTNSIRVLPTRTRTSSDGTEPEV